MATKSPKRVTSPRRRTRKCAQNKHYRKGYTYVNKNGKNVKVKGECVADKGKAMSPRRKMSDRKAKSPRKVRSPAKKRNPWVTALRKFYAEHKQEYPTIAQAARAYARKYRA